MLNTLVQTENFWNKFWSRASKQLRNDQACGTEDSVGSLVAGTGKYLKAKAAKSGYWLLDQRQKSIDCKFLTSRQVVGCGRFEVRPIIIGN